MPLGYCSLSFFPGNAHNLRTAEQWYSVREKNNFLPQSWKDALMAHVTWPSKWKNLLIEEMGREILCKFCLNKLGYRLAGYTNTLSCFYLPWLHDMIGTTVSLEV